MRALASLPVDGFPCWRESPLSSVVWEFEAPCWPARWQAIDRYIAEGKLRAYRVAGEKTIRIKREDVDALLSPIAGEGHVAETDDEHTRPRTGG